MTRPTRSWFHRLFARRQSSALRQATDTPPVVESLEARTMLSHHRIYPPQVTSVVADNRGLIILNFSQPLNPATVTTSSVEFILARRNRGATLTVSKNHLTLFVQHTVPANTGYRLLLDGTRIKGDNGMLLDGEFHASGNSGNGVQGGNFDFVTTGMAPTAVFSTVAGEMNVNLLTTQTPLTFNNFVAYANASDWDNTFFHRSVQSGFNVVQGGGFKLNASNQIVPVTSRGNINNETGLTDARGTLAMANAGPNTNTSQWYFNNKDNSAAFGNNYTVFGQLADAASYRVMDALAALPIFNATAIIGSTYSELPVVNHTGTGLNVSNLAFVYRVAMKDSIAKTPGT